MDKLWINSELADLDNNRAAINFQTWGLLTLSSRQAPWSFGLTLPDTALNRGLLGVPLMGSLTDIPYTKTPAMYEADGVFIIAVGGYIIIESINEEGNFVATIYSGTSEFFSKIKDKKITELTTLDHMNWLLSVLATSHRDQWSVIDWCNESPSPQFDDNPPTYTSCMIVDFMKMYPGETFKKIIAAIFAESGYSIFDIACDAWVDAKFNRMFIPCVNQLASPAVGVQMLQCECERTGSVWPSMSTLLASQTYIYLENPAGGYIHNWANALYIDGDPGGAQAAVMFCNIRSKGIYGFHVIIDVDWEAGAYSHILTFELYSITQGRALYGDILHIDTSSGNATWVINQNVEITEIGIVCVRIYDASWESGRDFFPKAWHFTCVYAVPENTAYGYDFDINRNLPEFTQSDLIKAWLNIMGLMLWVDEESHFIYVYKFSDLYKEIPEDWSEYFDSIIEIKYHAEGFAQSNKLKYSNDDTVWQPTGEINITLSDQALPENIDLIELPFSATDDVKHGNDNGIIGGVPMAKIRLRKAGVVENSITGRILLRDLVTMTGNGVDPALPVQLTGSYPLSTAYLDCYFAKFAGLDFATLTQDYYLELFLRVLDKAKIVRANFLLPPAIVKNRRANIPVYVKQLNGMFYCDIIENYMAGELSVVQLIRL